MRLETNRSLKEAIQLYAAAVIARWRRSTTTVCPPLVREEGSLSGSDLPQVPVRVAEVAEVTPLDLRRRLHDLGARPLGLGQDLIHPFLVRDDVIEGHAAKPAAIGGHVGRGRERSPR